MIFRSQIRKILPDVKKIKAISALNYVIPVLREFNFQWVITGGFACYVYGVVRPITDIDIDIKEEKDSAEFRNFLKTVKPHTTQPLEHYVDQNYDNYNLELTYQKQVIDICPMADLKIFNKATNRYESFYGGKFPDIEIVDFAGFKLPILSKELIIKNKGMLVWQRESDINDIFGLRKLLTKNQP